MTLAIYPGSFDPITLGHIDIVNRASQLFDRILIAVVTNTQKTMTFSTDERVAMAKTATGHLTNVDVDSFTGLTVELAKQKGAKILIRGLRAVSDFEFEFTMYQMNKQLNPDIEMVFMMAGLDYQFMSSSLVKEIASMHGDVSHSVPPAVGAVLTQRYGPASAKATIS